MSLQSRGRGLRLVRWIRALFHLTLISAALSFIACGEQEPAQEQAPPPAVGVARVEWAEVTTERSYSGRVEAIDVVELRARVEGFVEKRLFEEGAEVKTGDLLIVLEKGPYLARVREVKGQITAAEGTLHLAKIERDRQSTLVERGVAAQARLDQAEGEYQQALGELQRLRAALERAQLDLGYTDITAPIDGRIGRFAFSVRLR
jgi:membrane fusion protein (multidrug efflux system)